jgi:hypothetical protein
LTDLGRAMQRHFFLTLPLQAGESHMDFSCIEAE